MLRLIFTRRTVSMRLRLRSTRESFKESFPGALAAVLDWYVEHTPELHDNWVRSENGEPLAWIDPLE